MGNILHKFISNKIAEFQIYYKITSRLDNSVNSDQLTSEKPADLDLYCFQKIGYIQTQCGKGYLYSFTTTWSQAA